MQIVSISRERWDGQWMNRQHLMWAMKDFAQVLYVEEPRSFNNGVLPHDEPWLAATVRDVAPNVRVLRLPKSYALRTRDGAWNRFATAAKARVIRKYLSPTAAPTVIYAWLPDLSLYFDAFPEAINVYHMFDLPPSYLTAPHHIAKLADATTKARLCFGGTAEQVAALPADKVTLVPNAAPLEWYDEDGDEPEVLHGIPRPRIGYVGKISRKVDFDWLEALARVEEWQLVVTGPTQFEQADHEARWNALLERPNVHYLGFQRAQDVPGFVKALDVGLMCYVRGLWCEVGSPLKLYEYSAGGVPAVASRIDSLTTDEAAVRIVRFADTPDEAVAAVRATLADDARHNPTLQGPIRAFAAVNSWRARAALVHRRLAESAGR